MHLKDTPKNRRLVKGLKETTSNRIVEQELPEIPGAVERFEKLEKIVANQTKQIVSLEDRVQQLMAEKIQRDMEVL